MAGAVLFQAAPCIRLASASKTGALKKPLDLGIDSRV
jgi:hypothetical protein